MIGDEEYPLDAEKNVLTTPDPDVLFPLLKAMRERGAEVLIMETSSHALKLNKLCGMHFDLGIFTNFTQDHLDFHGGMEDYLSSKKKLFTMCDRALINYDDPSFEKIVKDLPCPYLSFSGGENNKADYIAKNVRLKDEHGVEYEMLTKEDIFRIRLPIPGQFTVSNSLAAASCAHMLGISRENIVPALLQMENVKGRIDRVKIDAPYSVFIDFAHTPDAMENVLKTIRQFARGRVITLFGCGGDRDRTKRPRMAETAAALSDVVVVTSDNSRSEEKSAIIADILVGVQDKDTPYTVVTNRVEAIHWAIENALPGDTILLAGKGHETYQILKDETIHLDEREVVADALAK
jgi:UDP-N-acetylmuramoyl-L-alanyl-D-glutamate--2,6-diaminopimelate ligase